MTYGRAGSLVTVSQQSSGGQSDPSDIVRWDRPLPEAAEPREAYSRVREWLRIDAMGHPELILVEKHDLVVKLGLNFRDLRTLDPWVPIPYPSSIMIRPQAVVINLCSIRMIIAVDCCYLLTVPKPGDPSNMHGTFPTAANPFVEQLVNYLRTGRQVGEHSGKSENKDGAQNPERHLPYELRALEGALDGCVRELQAELKALEAKAYPSLDSLTRHVHKVHLETIRVLKNTMTALAGRVHRVRQEVEDVLDDDQDMADLYLCRRAAFYQEQSKAEPPPSGPDAAGTPAAAPNPQPPSIIPATRSSSHHHFGYRSREPRPPVHPHDIQGAEGMLDTYYMQLDYIVRRLDVLKGRISDTEDLVAIDLDHRRNELVALTLLVTIITGGFTFVAMIAGIFGMNIYSALEALPRFWFWFTAGLSGVVASVLVGLALFYAKSRKLLFIPTTGLPGASQREL